MTSPLRATVAQHRDELIADLELMPSLCCPTCVITYIDPDQEDTCRTDCCQFDYEGTPAEILQEWAEKVLREAYRTAGMRLCLKWLERLNPRNDDRLLVNTLRLRHLYPNYDLEEFGRILDALRAANITLNLGRWQNWLNSEEYALLLLKQSAETE